VNRTSALVDLKIYGGACLLGRNGCGFCGDSRSNNLWLMRNRKQLRNIQRDIDSLGERNETMACCFTTVQANEQGKVHTRRAWTDTTASSFWLVAM
jgi:hypothetical protein